jgi:hypothetical protein
MAQNAETPLMHEILVAISALPGALFWRQQSGVFQTLTRRELVRSGIPGMADIGGIYRGHSVQVEVKTPAGRLSKEQKRWKNAVERAGGIFVCAKNPADALSVLAALIDATSGELPHPIHEQPADAKSAGNGEALL